MAKRRTIETRVSVLSTEFDIQRPLVRSLRGLEFWLENIIWDYHLRFFNYHNGYLLSNKIIFDFLVNHLSGVIVFLQFLG